MNAKLNPPKNAAIYYNQDRIIIASTYWDSIGFCGYGEPMAILPKDSKSQDIGRSVLRSLDASRGNLSEQELKNVTLVMLKNANLRSLSELDEKWDYIHIYFKQDESVIVINPLHRYETGGHVGNESDLIFKCHDDADKIGQAIRRILDGPLPEMIRHEPSHT